VLFLSLVASASAFQAGGFFPSSATGRSVQLRSAQRSANAPRVAARNSLALNMGFDIEGLNQKMKDQRLAHLEEQAMEALRTSVSGTSVALHVPRMPRLANAHRIDFLRRVVQSRVNSVASPVLVVTRRAACRLSKTSARPSFPTP
jgi:hypothetical protein